MTEPNEQQLELVEQPQAPQANPEPGPEPRPLNPEQEGNNLEELERRRRTDRLRLREGEVGRGELIQREVDEYRQAATVVEENNESGLEEGLRTELSLYHRKADEADELESELRRTEELNESMEEKLQASKRVIDAQEKIIKLTGGTLRERSTAVAMKPSKFVSGVDNIRTYLARFKVYAKASNIKEDNWALINLLTSYLDTRAQRRVLRLGLEKKVPRPTVEAALEEIVKELEEVYPKAQWRSKLFESKQKENERMSDFATRLAEDAQVAYEDAGMRKSVMLDVFVLGVRDDGIGKDLLKAKHTDFEEAVKHAIELESVYQARNKDEVVRHAVFNVLDNTQKCYNCGEPGHIRKDCPSQRDLNRQRPRPKPTCFSCGKPGHIAKNCYSANRNGPSRAREPPARGQWIPNRNAPRETRLCHNCKMPGHLANQCPKVVCYKCNQQGHVSTNCRAAANNAVEQALKNNRLPPMQRIKPATEQSN